jgi:hypothetical protein
VIGPFGPLRFELAAHELIDASFGHREQQVRNRGGGALSTKSPRALTLSKNLS